MTVSVYYVALVIALFMGWHAEKKWTNGTARYCSLFMWCRLLHLVRYRQINSRSIHLHLSRWCRCIVHCPTSLSWMVTMFEGREKRAVCIALINIVGELGLVYYHSSGPVPMVLDTSRVSLLAVLSQVLLRSSISPIRGILETGQRKRPTRCNSGTGLLGLL